MYKVYGDSLSGNCYKVRLILEQLDLPYQWEEVGATTGITATTPTSIRSFMFSLFISW